MLIYALFRLAQGYVVEHIVVLAAITGLICASSSLGKKFGLALLAIALILWILATIPILQKLEVFFK
jgi:hypothetical protein